MWKKITIIFLAIVMAISTFIYMQINKAEKNLAQILNQHHLMFEQLSGHFFPQPTLQLKKVQYIANNTFATIEEIKVEFSMISALIGKLRVKEISLIDSRIQDFDNHAFNLLLKPTEFYQEDISDLIHFFIYKEMLGGSSNKWSFALFLDAKNAQHDQINLNLNTTITATGFAFSQAALNINLSQSVYGGNKDFSVAMDEGYIGKALTDIADYEVNGFTRINGVDIGHIKTKIHWPNQKVNDYIIELSSDMCSDCTVVIALEKIQQQQKIKIQATYFPLDILFRIFKLPVLATGESNINAELHFNQQILKQGKFVISALNGKIQGINLLQLIAQYIPFNEIPDKEMDTSYEQLSAIFLWEPTSLLVDKIYLYNKIIQLSGEGLVELSHMQCDIRLNISVVEEKYKGLSLPIHFFNSCYSPQYKIEMNKKLRDQLKKYIKERVN